MNLSERHTFNKHSKRFKSLDNICFLSKNLYNYALYTIKQEYEKTGLLLRYQALDKFFKETNQPDYRALPNNSAQQILMVLDTNIMSFFKGLKLYQKDPSKFKGKPQFPKFKHKTKGRNIVIFTTSQLRVNKKDFIHFTKMTNLESIKLINDTKSFQQVRIIPGTSCYTIEIVYRKQEIPLKENNNKAAIDLGLKNLAALTFNNNEKTYIINGNPLKSVNQYYNKMVAKYKSELPSKVKTSNKIKLLSQKRNDKVNDYLHKASKLVVDKLLINNTSELIIGYNKGWKQNINLGSTNNQNFVSIPYLRFIDMITYKCQLAGIKVITNEESYTSKCSAMDLEKICKKDKYLGTRIKRGLYRSKQGIEINADINGSLNIGRKVFGNDYINSYQSNTGCGYHPIKITA